jgi:cytochrome c
LNAPFSFGSLVTRGFFCKGRFTLKLHINSTVAQFGAAFLFGVTCAPVAMAQDAAAPAIDAVAAKSLALRNSCLRCHGVTKKKEGPTYAAVAAKYSGKPDAEGRLYEHLTSGEVATMSDGHKELHKIIGTKKREEIRNLVRWILSQ